MAEREELEPLQRDDVFYRHVPKVDSADFIVTDDATGTQRLSSGAFTPDEDGVSIYIERVLQAYRLDATCLSVRPGSGVAGLKHEAIGGCEDPAMHVVPDPWPVDVPDPTEQRHAAHALIKGLTELGKSARRRGQRHLASISTVIYRCPDAQGTTDL